MARISDFPVNPQWMKRICMIVGFEDEVTTIYLLGIKGKTNVLVIDNYQDEDDSIVFRNVESIKTLRREILKAKEYEGKGWEDTELPCKEWKFDNTKIYIDWDENNGIIIISQDDDSIVINHDITKTKNKDEIIQFIHNLDEIIQWFENG